MVSGGRFVFLQKNFKKDTLKFKNVMNEIPMEKNSENEVLQMSIY